MPYLVEGLSSETVGPGAHSWDALKTHITKWFTVLNHELKAMNLLFMKWLKLVKQFLLSFPLPSLSSWYFSSYFLCWKTLFSLISPFFVKKICPSNYRHFLFSTTYTGVDSIHTTYIFIDSGYISFSFLNSYSTWILAIKYSFLHCYFPPVLSDSRLHFSWLVVNLFPFFTCLIVHTGL